MKAVCWFTAVVGFAAAALPAHAVVLSQGHGDVGMWYVPGSGYQLRLSSGDAWQADPASSTIVLGDRSLESTPSSLATATPGLAAGSPLWKLPQSATEAALDGAPWLGMQVHGGPLGTATTDGAARLSIELVSASGPGQFLMWQDLEPNLHGSGGPGGPGFESRPDLVAVPGAAFDSAALSGSHVDCWQHMHAHMNWGFTAPGEYLVTLNVSGETAADGPFSNAANFRFLVQDEIPATPRIGDLTGDRVVDYADLAMLSRSFGTTSGATQETGDLDGDGRVGLRDLVLLRNEMGAFTGPTTTQPDSPNSSWQTQHANLGATQFGAHLSTTLANAVPATVPEPHSLALASCGLVVAWHTARRKRRKLSVGQC